MKAEFSASLLQCHVICWVAAQETFLIIVDVENSCAASCFCGNRDTFIVFLIFFHSKEQHLFEIEIFCNIINAFTVTFDQFNVSLMNKSIHVFLFSDHL